MADIVIVGAGLTGLAAAYHLEKQGIFDYQIVEQNDRPGGLLRSFQQDGFTFDFTGHLLHINNDYFRNFLSDIASFDHLDHVQRKSAVHTHNKITEYPFQMNLYGLPSEVIYECINGFINRKTSIKKPITFVDWVMKYFGSGIGKYFFYPYQSKIFAYDHKKLLASWTGRFVPKTSLKDMIDGAVTQPQDRNIGYNSFFYYPKSGGIEHIVQQLAKSIKNKIITNQAVTNIDLTSKTVHFNNGTKTSYKQLISTMPLNTLLGMTKSSRTRFAQASKKLLCNSVINFNLGFNKKDISDKHWYYFPEKKYLFYRVGFWNNICPSSVKKDCSAIYGEFSYLPGSKTPQQIESMKQKAKNQALEFLKLTSSNIVTEKCLHLKHAYVIYDQWREKNLSKILTQLQSENIHSVGRFGEWKYSSMQEAVLDGKQVAELTANSLQKTNAYTIFPAVPCSKTNKKSEITKANNV